MRFDYRRDGHDVGPAPAGAGPTSNCSVLAGLACRGSGGADAGGLRALRALGYLELHVLVLLQAAETAAVDLGVVHGDGVTPEHAGALATPQGESRRDPDGSLGLALPEEFRYHPVDLTGR